MPTELNALGLPTDPFIYSLFPSATFSVGAFWGSGDYLDQLGAFQYIDSTASFTISSVAITAAVPEPGAYALLLGLGSISAVSIFRRRQKQTFLQTD